MRSIFFSIVSLASALIAAPVWGQSWSGALPAVQSAPGAPSDAILSFELPSVSALEAWDVRIAYSAEVFEPLLPGAFSSSYPFVFDLNTVALHDPRRDDFPGLTGSDIQLLESKNALNAFVYEQVNVAMLDLGTGAPVFPLDHPGGALFQVRFQAKSAAALGPTTVFAHFIYGTSTSEELALPQALLLSADIAPIPEPETWILMLAGLALVGVSIARVR